MLNYETFCQIRDHLCRQQLTVAQTARALALDPRTVAKWADVEQFHPRAGVARTGKLDAYKGQIVRWLDAHPYSAQQIFQRLREAGYDGGVTLVKDYVHRIRPRHPAAFLKLDFAAGECAQVDWGEYGSIAVGSTRRRLSFFLMVLCYAQRKSPWGTAGACTWNSRSRRRWNSFWPAMRTPSRHLEAVLLGSWWIT